MRLMLIAFISLTLCACASHLELIKSAARADREEPRAGDRVLVTFTDGERQRKVFESVDRQTLQTREGPIPLAEIESIEIDPSSMRIKIERFGRTVVASMGVLFMWMLWVIH